LRGRLLVSDYSFKNWFWASGHWPQLSPEHRAVIVLKVIEDLQYQEIAKTLNISVGTVMSRLFYGVLCELRKKLHGWGRIRQQPNPLG